MAFMSRKLFSLAALLALCACGTNSGSEVSVEPVTYTYEESFEDFANPERGFYKPFEFRNAQQTITADQVRECVEQNYTLLLYEFYLTEFMESDISQEYLDNIAACFSALRQGGAKCVLRFAYKSRESDTPWDASPEWVARHIGQLTDVIRANSDVICCWQAGFVGVWGEWYYTDHFVMNPSSDEDYQPRRKVIDAMLAALPENRQVAVRTPTFKIRMFGLDFDDVLTKETAHDGSALSRIGAFNDCFVADPTDVGTYDSEKHREFWAKDNRYLFMGGETCRVDENSCQCGFSLSELATYHWSYLNSAYNRKVLQVWKDGQCFDEVACRLGYRFVLESCTMPAEVRKSDDFDLECSILNVGYAAPSNPRGLELVFVDEKGRQTVCPLDDDPRFWMDSSRHILKASVAAPRKAGAYKVYLSLPDPQKALYGIPSYSIRFANKDIWDAENGWNFLAELKVR